MGIRPFYDGPGAVGSGALLAEVVEQQAQKQIVRIMKDNKMLNEDIKGIDIDLNF